MPVYEYAALDKKGKKVSGIIDAESATVARQKLRGDSIFLTSIKQVDQSAASGHQRNLKTIRLFDRVKSADVSLMTRQLSTLLDAGFPLVTAIDALIPQISAPSFKKIIAQLKTSVVEGSSLANALSAYPRIFSPLYINMIHAGESSGTLEVVLERLADLMEKQDALRSNIRSKMFYPIFMTIFGAAVLFFLMTNIVPNITSIFQSMQKTLPAPTLFLIAASDFFKFYWWVMIIILMGIIFLFYKINRTSRGRAVFDRLRLSLPLIGPISKKLTVSRFSRTLGSLLENGVTMMTALDIVKNIVNNVLISNAIESAAVEVGKGQALAQSLSTHEVLPHLAVQMVQVGEQSGSLEAMLHKLANIYENEAESTIMGLTALLEPVMILIMGVVVGTILLATMLPILEMSQLVV